MKRASGFTLEPHTFPWAYADVKPDDGSEEQFSIYPPSGTLLEDFLDGIAEGRLVHHGAVVTFEKAWLCIRYNKGSLQDSLHAFARERSILAREQYFVQESTGLLLQRAEMLRIWGSFVESQERRIQAEMEWKNSNAEEAEPTSTIYVPRRSPYVYATFTNPQTNETEQASPEENVRTELEEWLDAFPTGHLTYEDGQGASAHYDLVRPLAREDFMEGYRAQMKWMGLL